MQAGDMSQFLVWGYAAIGVVDGAVNDTANEWGTATDEEPDLEEGGDTRSLVGS